MVNGVPEPRVGGLRDRIAKTNAYSVDSGGLSGGTGAIDGSFGRSGLYDGYDPTTRFSSNGVTMRPARLIDRVARRGSTMQGIGEGG